MAGWDKSKAVAYLNSEALAVSTGNCAKYTREAIVAGGITVERTQSAKDYGWNLVLAGFRELQVSPDTYAAGDVVVIDGFSSAPDGHMAMYNGTQWVSDFKQRDLYPGPRYRTAQPKYKVYRYGTGK